MEIRELKKWSSVCFPRPLLGEEEKEGPEAYARAGFPKWWEFIRNNAELFPGKVRIESWTDEESKAECWLETYENGSMVFGNVREVVMHFRHPAHNYVLFSGDRTPEELIAMVDCVRAGCSVCQPPQ